MRWVLLIIFLSTGSFLSASQRVLVAEEFTGTWCHFCPGAARGLDENYIRSYDSLVVIAYHISDAFAIPECETRRAYYGVSAYPTVIFDGTITNLGGAYLGTMYPFYRHILTSNLAVPSQLRINLVCNYDSIANTGLVTATIINDSSSTIAGNLHFAIVENDIPYNWQGMDELDYVLRDMLPDASGEAVTIPAGDSIIRSRNFTIGQTWNENNCKIVVFVQASNKIIFQGAEIGIIPEPEMEYYGMRISEINGNNNGWAEPGEGISMDVSGKNLGNGIYTGGAGISCADPYITITSQNPLSVAIGPGGLDTVLNFTFNINANCPSPHQLTFVVNFGSTIDTIPFIITTNPGFSDSIESGEDGWVHSGTKDNWHITTYRSHSPSHSWYCGVETYHQYTNENDASLYSPYFVVAPNTNLYFYHLYSLAADLDYGYVEIDNGSGWWQTLGEFNGNQNNWIQYSYSLQDYSGQTCRLRFRFISDYTEYVIGEGWYIDDVVIPPSVGIEETEMPSTYDQSFRLAVQPNPSSGEIEINYVPGALHYEQELPTIYVYDAMGRLVRQFGHQVLQQSGNQVRIVWEPKDDFGRRLPVGLYFVRLEVGDYNETERVILLR